MYYQKVRLSNPTNGMLKGYGILVHADNGSIYFAGDGSVWGESDDSEQPFQASCEHGVCIRKLCTLDPLDSLTTAVLSIRNDDAPAWFTRWNIALDPAKVQLSSILCVDLDGIFLVEARESAASSGLLIKPAYTQTEMYSGFGVYHSNQRTHRFNTPVQADKPWRIGVELEVYARNQEAYNKITGARTNWFQCEGDGSLNERQFPIELKTIPLRACDATSTDFWNEPMKALSARAISKQYLSTGLHVHIGKEIFGSTESVRQDNLSKLCVFYSYFVEDNPDAHAKNVVICGREQCYGAVPNVKTPIGDFAKLVGIDKVGESPAAFKMVGDGVKEGWRDRRGDINIKNWNTYGTIEFRKGKGAISKTRLAAICAWWEEMCLYCNETHPKDFSFDAFFERVCRKHPAVAYFFLMDEEC